MKQITAYQADNGTLFKTAEEALHQDEIDRVTGELKNQFSLAESNAYEIAVWIAENFSRKSEEKKT